MLMQGSPGYWGLFTQVPCQAQTVDLKGGAGVRGVRPDNIRTPVRPAAAKGRRPVKLCRYLQESPLMCGIVGAIADRDVVPVLIEGLKRLEYRGYDSAGIAVLDVQEVRRVRRTGRVSEM